MSGPELLLCVPAYNEGAIIRKSLQVLKESLKDFPYRVEIVVVDNASTDATADEVRALPDPGISCVTLARKGKGTAVWEGANIAKNQNIPVYGFIDADLSANPREIAPMYEEIRRGSDIVVASRLLDKRKVTRSFLRTVSSEGFNLLRRLILGVTVRDTQCGLKLMNARGVEYLLQCKEHTWFIDMEFLARAQYAGLTITEIPVEWQEFRFPDRKSKLNVLRDGIAAIIAMFRIRIGMLQS